MSTKYKYLNSFKLKATNNYSEDKDFNKKIASRVFKRIKEYNHGRSGDMPLPSFDVGGYVNKLKGQSKGYSFTFNDNIYYDGRDTLYDILISRLPIKFTDDLYNGRVAVREEKFKKYDPRELSRLNHDIYDQLYLLIMNDSDMIDFVVNSVIYSNMYYGVPYDPSNQYISQHYTNMGTIKGNNLKAKFRERFNFYNVLKNIQLNIYLILKYMKDEYHPDLDIKKKFKKYGYMYPINIGYDLSGLVYEAGMTYNDAIEFLDLNRVNHNKFSLYRNNINKSGWVPVIMIPISMVGGVNVYENSSRGSSSVVLNTMPSEFNSSAPTMVGPSYVADSTVWREGIDMSNISDENLEGFLSNVINNILRRYHKISDKARFLEDLIEKGFINKSNYELALKHIPRHIRYPFKFSRRYIKDIQPLKEVLREYMPKSTFEFIYSNEGIEDIIYDLYTTNLGSKVFFKKVNDLYALTIDMYIYIHEEMNENAFDKDIDMDIMLHVVNMLSPYYVKSDLRILESMAENYYERMNVSSNDFIHEEGQDLAMKINKDKASTILLGYLLNDPTINNKRLIDSAKAGMEYDYYGNIKGYVTLSGKPENNIEYGDDLQISIKDVVLKSTDEKTVKEMIIMDAEDNIVNMFGL